MSNPSFLLLLHYGFAVVTALCWSVTAQYSCPQDGFFCADCKNQVYCSQTVANVLTCPTDKYCSQETRSCTATSCEDFTCETYPFNCTHGGNFPDLHNCSRYVICPPTGSIWSLGSCPPNTVFDPCQGSCSANAVCHDPPSKCATVGDKGAVPNNPEMYYICKIDFALNCIYPELNWCSEGIFDVTTESCVSIGVDVCLM